MKLFKIFFVISIIFLTFSSLSAAGDFDWVKDFNIKAELDPDGFKARLRARFKIGNAEIDAVFSNVEEPADAYMVFRLGEMSKRSTNYVVEKHKGNRGKGWGTLAKSLGIKPGSKEFHALQRGHDLYVENSKVKEKDESKNKDKGKSKK